MDVVGAAQGWDHRKKCHHPKICIKRSTKINLTQLYLSIKDFIRDYKLHDLSYIFTDISIFCAKSAIFDITTYLHNSYIVSSNFNFLVFIIFYSFH